MAPKSSIEEFQDLLAGIVSKSKDGKGGRGRMLAILGAGLAAPSGLPTMRGPGGLWQRKTAAVSEPTNRTDLEMVWLYYAWRHHLTAGASPNAAHKALASLARHRHPQTSSSTTAAPPTKDGESAASSLPGFELMCLNLSLDDLLVRAGYPPESLRAAFGSNMALVCTDTSTCSAVRRTSTTDRPCPSLVSESDEPPRWLTDPTLAVPDLEPSRFPHCAACGKHLVRPTVQPNRQALADVDDFVARKPAVDVALVVGTAAVLPPAPRYLHETMRHGAVVVVVNPDPAVAEGLRDEDFFFQGDAAEILPRLFGKVIS
ncbi:hypothetical protein MCOR27_006437 [Pyricularia oryzae]|uniref:Deacetylase sirtuin-type domain-containing protein n=5 Tax=Pyricularia TaxID=48558 RepID=A0ABQ8NHR5_PYRGI|nr:uncharacterized protein MGG_06770 [Pyricularia oryzae 70-15]ELQ38591.1 hypothetical protein OOU_Y34scaffold00534g66 [Pyricularia oryzae Y34]KAH8842363.1 hypothetical protein MCOR01_006271 [Pyricularia oryzae]KAI6297192.1 hypothetical protein MCOR33_006393 [Pyricularia grisea]EHA56874.1 hypothetical protein MGG_06770 [Pyricularia oryzae 70-15]KAI6258907.1 hypothetical protein MCOR19_004749 [Pyricularia oryzae]